MCSRSAHAWLSKQWKIAVCSVFASAATRHLTRTPHFVGRRSIHLIVSRVSSRQLYPSPADRCEEIWINAGHLRRIHVWMLHCSARCGINEWSDSQWSAWARRQWGDYGIISLSIDRIYLCKNDDLIRCSLFPFHFWPAIGRLKHNACVAASLWCLIYPISSHFLVCAMRIFKCDSWNNYTFLKKICSSWGTVGNRHPHWEPWLHWARRDSQRTRNCALRRAAFFRVVVRCESF